MTIRYTLFIDESGDAGIQKVRDGIDSKGASPMLVIGGCLVPKSRTNELLALIAEIKGITRRDHLHCSKMSHFAVAKYARMVGERAGIKCFALVSTKSTIGGFKDRIEGKGQDQRYYNKCVSYFLERVGHFVLLNEIDTHEVEIVFEEREGHNYEKLRNYIRTIKRTPHDERLGYYLAPIDPDRISSVPKSANELLCYPDLVAFSVAAALDASASNFGVPEQRYLREIKRKFFHDAESGAIGEFGLKIFKRYELNWDAQTTKFVEKMHVEGVDPNLHDGGAR